MTRQEVVNIAKEVVVLNNNSEDIWMFLKTLHPSDQAVCVEFLVNDGYYDHLSKTTDIINPEYLIFLDERSLKKVINYLGIQKTCLYISALKIDDCIKIIEKLDIEDRLSLITSMPDKIRIRVKKILSYPISSIGRVMNSDFISENFWSTAKDLINKIQTSGFETTDISEVIVTDDNGQYFGVVSLSAVLTAPSGSSIEKYTKRTFKTLRANEDQREAVKLIKQYGHSIIPVTNSVGKVVGVIDSASIVEIIQQTKDDQILSVNGIIAPSKNNSHFNIFKTAENRFIWLFINLLTCIIASMVISAYKGTIEKMAMLAVLMPIISSIGGNSGGQTASTFIRMLSDGSLEMSNMKRNLLFETATCFANGVLFFMVAFIVAYVWSSYTKLSIIFGFSMFITITLSGILGCLLPIFISKTKIDPALSSIIILTTFTDIIGFFSFLSLSKIFVVG